MSRTHAIAAIWFITVTCLSLVIVLPSISAASVSVISAAGNANGISGTVSIDGADPSKTIMLSTCRISSSTGRDFSTKEVQARGGLSDYIPLRSVANGIYKFSCYFDGPSQVDRYIARIDIMLNPYDWLTVDTAMYMAGGGNGTMVTTKTQPTTQTNTTQTRTTSSSANSTSTPIASTSRSSLFYTAFVTIGVIVITAAYLYMWNRNREIAPKTMSPTDKKLEPHRFCINCGTPLPSGSTACDKCGAKQT